MIRRYSLPFCSLIQPHVWLAGFAMAAGLLINGNQLDAQSSDMIRLHSSSRSARGKITRVSEKTVVIQTTAGERTIDVFDIKSLEYGNEPDELGAARREFRNTSYDSCIENLDKIDESKFDQNIKAEIAFYRFIAAARLSFMGSNVTATDAGNLAIKFLNNHATNWHYYEGAETMGDLAMVAGRFDSAADYYGKVAQCGWPVQTARAQLKLAEANIHNKKFNEANDALTSVLETNSNDDVVQLAKQKAHCFKALVAAKNGNAQAGIDALQKIIKDQDASQKDLFATAYNCLGYCYLEAKQEKEALFAFLHTDLLYHTQHFQHAEALYHLADLWKKNNDTDRGNRAMRQLKQDYRNSHWASK